MKHLSFDTWMLRVDFYLDEEIGCVSLDLPDCDYWAEWNIGTNPLAMATQAIKNAGGF